MMAILSFVVVAAALVLAARSLRPPPSSRASSSYHRRLHCSADQLFDDVCAQIRRKDITSIAQLLGPYVRASSSSAARQHQLLAGALHLTLGKTRARRAAQAALLLSATEDAGADATVLFACRRALHVLDPVVFAPAPLPSSTWDGAPLSAGLFWDALAGVQTESQQRPNWFMEQHRPLDVITSLAAVDAVVRDAPLLLAARAAPTPAPAPLDPPPSLYAVALQAMQSDGNGRGIAGPLGAFLARACLADPRLRQAVQLTHEGPPDGCLLPDLRDAVLTVGDGDLSFSAAVDAAARPPGPAAVTATSLEAPEALYAKYAGARANAAAVEASGRVLFHVDATALDREVVAGRLAAQRHRAVVFNFPFADADGGAHTHAHAVAGFDSAWVARGRHRALLTRFLRSARALLVPAAAADGAGAVYVTVLLSQALAWGVEEAAAEAGYALVAVRPFEGAAWAAGGYRRKRTYGDATFPTDEVDVGEEGGDSGAVTRR